MRLADRLRALEDPRIAPYPDAYDPSVAKRLSWKVRYKAASKGVPLTPNEFRIRRYANRYSGQTAVLMGNGPTLNRVDFDLLRGVPTFGVNAIYLKADDMGFLPTHYLVEDVYVAEDRAAEISALRGPTKWFGNYLRYAIRGDSDTIWLNVSVKYGQFKGFPTWSFDASRIIYCGGTVSYLAMQLAYFMGFRRLVLVGFDHEYQIPEEAVVQGNKIVSAGPDPNHFDGSYFGEGKRWHLPMVERMEIAYRKADRYWRADEREIVNATEGGALEVFPRIPLAQALEGQGLD